MAAPSAAELVLQAEPLPESRGAEAAEQLDDLLSLLRRVTQVLERAAPTIGPAGEAVVRDALAAVRRAAGYVEGRPPEALGTLSADGGRKSTVLVVDDNAAVRRLVVRQLGELGYRALEAEDGPSALMILNQDNVDLLFTDVVMPGGMSGFDLARLVLSRWPSMKALITSGFPELEPEGNSASQAKLRRLIKPYRKNDLANALREVLDS